LRRCPLMKISTRIALTLPLLSVSGGALAAGSTEFCLEGEFDLGARYQGTRPGTGESYATTWCITTDDTSGRVHFSALGNSNADMEDAFTLAYLPPDIVRILDYQPGHDIEFSGTDDREEALRARRADPRRLLEELRSSPQALVGLEVQVQQDRVTVVRTSADLPLRGGVKVEWLWGWDNEDKPHLRLVVDGELLFRATGQWRELSEDEADALWKTGENSRVQSVPGVAWPSRVDMHLEKLADGVYLVEGVRTGFQHLVVDTSDGLVVADAPAGWVEFQHIPPTELVPGLGVSGLSERLVDFLSENFPGRPIEAVALTHFHDDHAGGARAFAAAGADVYASAQSAGFLEHSLNRVKAPGDRLGTTPIRVIPVANTHVIGSEPNRVKLLSMGASPHSYDTLGVWALDKDIFFVSDVHVPRSDAGAPEEDRARTECWFAGWASKNLPANVRVVNTHSSAQTPVARLGAYLESDICQAVDSLPAPEDTAP
jgi:glyoxylase-like metal-dependent hydrolase (beta-lactamase superfamily II)